MPSCEGVSKLEQAPPCRTICTSSGFCTGDFPVYRGLQEIKLLHGAARPRFDTGSTLRRRSNSFAEPGQHQPTDPYNPGASVISGRFLVAFGVVQSGSVKPT